jgi:hypothetical protein
MDGVVYIAYGKDYINEARQSLASLRQHTNLPACIVSDVMVNGFDYWLQVEPRPDVKPLINKPYLLAGARLPFHRFVLLDTDTLILGDIAPVFGLLDRFDVLVTHSQQRHTGRGAFASPLGYCHFNTGVIWFNQNTRFFISYWAEMAYTHRQIYGNNDQPAFGEALYGSDLRFYVLPPEFNLRIASNRAFASGKVYILHGRRNKLRLATEQINESTRPRVWDLGKVEEL